MISQTNCYELDAGSIYKGLLSVTPNKGYPDTTAKQTRCYKYKGTRASTEIWDL